MYFMAKPKGVSVKPKTADLTLRLTPDNRRAIEAAAAADHLPASTWARRLLLREVDEQREDAARRDAGRALARRLRDLPPAPEHAAEVERARTRDWKR